MRASEMRELSDTELEHKLDEVRTELFNLRFQLATGQLDNPMSLKQIKKDIARIQTIRQERKLSIEVTLKEAPKKAKPKKSKDSKKAKPEAKKEKVEKAKKAPQNKMTKESKKEKAS